MAEAVNSPILDRAHPLYDKYVETQGFSHPSSIVLRILEGKRNVGQTTEHVLHIEVTDERDMQVIFYADVNEANYQRFKENSRLTVPFGDLPTAMIRIIDRCLQGDIPSPFPDQPATRYSAKLDLTTGLFTVMETSNYSTIDHMCIKLTEGNDQAIKEYLASRLQLSMDVAEDRKRQIAGLRRDMQAATEQRADVDRELQNYRTTTESARNSLTAAHEREVNQLCAAHMETLERERSAAAAVKADLDAKLQEGREALNALNAESMQTIRDLQFQLDSQRLQLEEVTKKYAAELDWKARAERDFESTVQKAGDVSVRCQSYSEQNAALKGQLSIAEQSIASLEKRFAQQEALTAAAEEAKRGVEARLQDKADALAAALTELGNTREELRVRNEDVERMKERVARADVGVKQKNDILRKQEAKVQKLEGEVTALTLQVQHEQLEGRLLQQELGTTKVQLAEALDRVAKLTEMVESDRQALAYMEEQNGKLLLGAGFTSPVAGKGYEDSYYAGAGSVPQQPTPATEDAYARYSARGDYSYDAAAGLAPAAVTPSLTGAKGRWEYTATAQAADGGYGRDTYSSTYAYEDKQYTSGAKAYTPTHQVSEDFLRGDTTGTTAPLRKEWLAPDTSAVIAVDHSGVDLDLLEYYSLEGTNDTSVGQKASRSARRAGVR